MVPALATTKAGWRAASYFYAAVTAAVWAGWHFGMVERAADCVGLSPDERRLLSGAPSLPSTPSLPRVVGGGEVAKAAPPGRPVAAAAAAAARSWARRRAAAAVVVQHTNMVG